ncbi:MAG: isochorismate synthase [Actinomycetota bacterium]
MRVRSEYLDHPVDLPALLPETGGFLWARGGEGTAGWGRAATIAVPSGRGRFDAAWSAATDAFAALDVDDEVVLSGRAPIAFGSFNFDIGVAGSVLTIPEVLVGSRGGRAWVTVVGDRDLPDLRRFPKPDAHDFKIRYAGSTISEIEWLDAVARAVKALKQNDLEKVVLARDIHVWSKEAFDLTVLLTRLARRFPECYTFACDGLVGATPELLIGRAGSLISSLVLAGTAPRGEGAEDERIGAELLASVKDRAEHAPAVVSVNETLAPLCDRLHIDPEPFLLRLANLQHLATRVNGTLKEPISSLELAGRLHPTAAVCGAPPEKAMELIRDLEGMSRDRYAGPVGWVDAAGNGEWGIALRCAEFHGTRGRLFAGGGLVADSRPEAELEETRLKFQAIRSALGSEAV